MRLPAILAPEAVSRERILAARVVGVLADAIQLGLMPLFSEGALSPVNDVLDVVVAALLTVLVGWHWAFLPAFLAELIPVFDLVPTWTVAVMVATGKAPATKVIGPTEALSGPESPGRLPASREK